MADDELLSQRGKKVEIYAGVKFTFSHHTQQGRFKMFRCIAMERPSKVFHKGHFYRLSFFKDDKCFYDCHRSSCNGRLMVNFDSGERAVTIEHTHGTNPAMTPTRPGWLDYQWL
ncbi:hypothetical protein AAVH_07050 [Aphelenchoides avenae]|nr:hypothetical protein AAVH_07050 [Aphelenchus avenae]